MEKDFDKWNIKKKIIDQREITVDRFVNEREIWWCSLGLNVGYEQDGKNEEFERPVLVIKKFNKEVVWIVPLTSVVKNDKFHYKLKSNKSFVILSQIKLISTKRFIRRAEKIAELEFKEVVEKVKSFFP